MILGYDFIVSNKILLDTQDKRAIFTKMNLSIYFEESDLACYSLKHVINCDSQKHNEDLFIKLRKKYDSLFSKQVGKIKNFELTIKLNNNEPFKGRSYPVPETYHAEISQKIDGMVDILTKYKY